MSLRSFDSQVSLGSQVSLPHLPAALTRNAVAAGRMDEVITLHLASSEQEKGVALVQKSSEIPLNF